MSTISTSTSIGQSNVGSYSWPITVSGSGTTVRFTTDLTFSDSSHYFIIRSDGVTIDGSGHTVTVINTTGYPGLIDNNSGPLGRTGSIAFGYTTGYSNLTVQNINISADINSYLRYLGGWIGGFGFGSGATNNNIINCHNNAQISTDQCGGICGGQTGRFGGNVIIQNCSNSGAITNNGNQSGGICGLIAGYNGSVTAINCYNTGNITSGGGGGIFGGNAAGGGYAKAINCYNIGNINSGGAGGICGSGGSGTLIFENCYNIGNINNNQSGGICGSDTGNGGGNTTIIKNCYNTGTVGNGSNPAGGMIGHIYWQSRRITITNCYNVGTIMPNSNSGNGVDGLIGQNDTGVSQNLSYCYSVNGADNWVDATAQNDLSGAPVQIPGTGAEWIALGQNTPFLFASSLLLPSPLSENDAMYSPNSYVSDLTNYYTSNAAAQTSITGTYSVLYVSDGTDPVNIPIDPNTGIISIMPTTFATVGQKNIYILLTANTGPSYQIGYFTYTKINYVSIDQAYVNSASWPVTLSDPTAIYAFTENLTLNSTNKYFVIGTDGLTIDGRGHTVTIDGVTRYPGLVKNGDSGNYGFSNISVQNIRMYGTNGSVLANDGGWVGQTYFSRNAMNNNFINCSNYASAVTASGRGGGIIGVFAGGNGEINAINCSNHGTASDGGIFGAFFGGINGSGPCGGTAVALNCSNTGDILSNGYEGGGIYGQQCGATNYYGYNSSISAINCYNTGNIIGTGRAGGIFGFACGINWGVNGKMTLIAQNCYNTGSIPAGGRAAGIYGLFSDNRIDNFTMTNCYNVGTIGASSAGIYYSNVSSPNQTVSNNYSVNGPANWSDIDASNTLLGAPSTTPGSGLTWTSRKQNTPFFLAYSMTLPTNTTENDAMYSPASYNNDIINAGYTISSTLGQGTYSIIYISDGTDHATISIDTTGTMTFAVDTFSAAGTRTFYVLFTTDDVNYQIGYFTYTNLYTNAYAIKTISQTGSTISIDGTEISSWPYQFSSERTCVQFTSELILNDASQYFQIGAQNIIIDGQEHMVTIDGVTGGYPGLIQNGQSNVTVQNINMAAINGSVLSYYAGWIGQAYFGEGRSNNQFINCSNSAQVNGSGGGGIIGGRSGQNGGNIIATNCSNSGAILHGGGIFGECCGCESGSITAINCYNSGTIVGSSGNGSSGIIGDSCGYNNGTVIIQNCYNTGTVSGNSCGGIAAKFTTAMRIFTITNCYNSGAIPNSTAAGILGEIRYDASAPVILTNCYNSGLAANLAYGLVGSNQTSSSAVEQINCLSDSTWSDSNVASILTGGPSSKPGSGATWTSLKQNTPFLFASSLLLPIPLSENDAMYSPNSAVSDPTNYYISNAAQTGTAGTYSVFYVSDGSDPANVPIDPNTGTILIVPSTFATTGQKNIYILFTENDTYQIGYFTYTKNNYVVIDQAYVNSASWPVTIGEDTVVEFQENLTLNNSNQYFVIDGQNIVIDGSGYTVTIDGVTDGYPGLVKNGDSGNYGFSNISVQNIRMYGTNGSVLANDGGWVGQTYFSRNAMNNNFINCSNYASAVTASGRGGGIIGVFAGGNGEINAINCSNHGTASDGGIFGAFFGGINGSGPYGGTAVALNCSNTGDILSNGYEGGGIYGNQCGATNQHGYNSSISAINCYNTGNIQGTGRTGGIFGVACGINWGVNGKMTLIAQNCYNTGSIPAGGRAAGIYGLFSDNRIDNFTMTNCYNVGTIGASSAGIYYSNVSSPNQTVSNNYSVNGPANWSDIDASNTLLGAPSTTPGSGLTWTSRKQNTPFYFTSDFPTLPSPLSGNNNMYSPNTYNNTQFDFDYTANILTPIAGATYSVYYVSDGTATSVIPINPSTGKIDLLATTFPTAGTRTIYVICTVGGSYIMGYFTYTNLYTQYFNPTPLLVDQTFMDNVAANGTPYVLSESYTRILFTSDLNLNNPCQYFNVQCANLIIDGSGHTVTIDGIGGYQGLIQNGTSNSVGFNTITVQNINMAATNGSSLAVLAGWIGQAYFGQGATNNYFTNCTNSARIDSGGRAGGITGAYTGYNHGNVTATKCSNTGEIIGYDFNSPGGIFGDYSGYIFGTITATDCFNTGNISGWQPGCGGIFGSWCGSIGGNVYAIDCYNTGAIGTFGGGIFGHSCGLKNEGNMQDPGYLSAYNCYNTGNMTGSSSGGIFGYHCGYYSPATIVNCYNTGTIGGSYNGGICGQECCQGGGNLTIQNCYNTGSVDTANNNGGILVDFYQDGSTLNISNCYSSGVLSNPANLLYGIYGNLNVSLDSIHCYVVSGLANWSDLDADTLLDVPTVKPGSSMKWTSFSPNTPFLLATTVTLPTLPGTDIYYSNASMYTPTSASNDPNTNSYTTSAGSSSKGTYNVLYVSDGTDPTAIQINASSGSMSFGPSTFKTNGIKTIYVLFTVNGNPRGGKYFIGFFTYTINNYVSINQDYIDNANTNNLWPITFSESNTFISFTVNLTLNNSNQYFVIGANNITIDGQEHTVTIDGVNNYPGLIQNGTSGTNGYANITVQNIHIAATNGSALTNNGGWIGQTYFGQAALNNNFINCSNSGSLAYWCGGIIGAYGAYNGGHLTATNCYNTGNISGESAGGIFGTLCGNNGGYISAINCYNTGSISGKYAGGIFGNSCVADYGTMYVINCYNTGSITGIDAGGIVGNYCAHNSAILQIANCYNSGNVMENSAGGIFGAYNNYPNASISNCYNSGTIVNSNIFNGIFSSNNSFSGTLQSINCYSVNGPANWLDSDALVDLSGVPASVPGTGSVWTAFGQNTPFLFATYAQIPAGATLSEMYTVTSYTNPDPLVYTGFASTEGDGNYSILYVSDGSTQSINQITGALTIYPVIGTIKIIVYNQTTNHISMFTYTGYYAVAYMPFYIDQSFINNNQTWPIAITSPYTFVQFTSNLVLSDSSWYISIQCDNVLIDGKDKTVTIDGVADYPGLIDNHNFGDHSNIIVQNINMLARNGSSSLEYSGWIGQRYFGQTAINISFINCTNTALVGFAGGGICGSECSSSLTVTKCSNHGDIKSYAGGILGYQNGKNNAALNISFCYNTGNLIEDNAGGIIGAQAGHTSGWGSYINITDCYNTGSVNNTCGGIIGQYMLPSGRAVVTVTNCYNQGAVANGGVGIIAYPISNPEPVVIRNCYSSGNISDLTWGITKDSGINVDEYYVVNGAANWSDASAVETIIIPVPFAIGQILPMSSQQAYSFSCCISATGQYLANCNDDNKSIMFSSNYGNTWSVAVSNGRNRPNTVCCSSDGKYFYGNVGVGYKSTDYGATWTTWTINSNYYYIICDASGKNVYAQTDNHIGYSHDYGNTWSTTSTTNLPNYNRINILYVSKSGQYVYASTSRANIIYKSSDYGQSYNVINNILVPPDGDGESYYDMAISGDGQTIYVLFYWRLVISTDGGNTWSIVNGLPDNSNWRVTGYYLNISCDSTGQYLYANHTGSITYISSNYGATWTTNSVLYSQNRNTPLQQSDTGIFFSGKQLYLSNQTAVDTAIANNMTPLPPSIIHGLSGGPLTIPGVGAIWKSTAANTPFTLTSLIPPPPPPPPSLPTHILDETMYPAPTTILLPSESFTSPPANINGGTYSIYDISGGVPENTITIDSVTGSINIPAGTFPSGGFFTVRVLNLSTSGIYTLGYLYFNIYQTIIYIHQADMDTISWPMTITDSLTLVNFAENLTLTSSNQYFIIGNNQITINGGGYKVTVNGVTNGYRGLVQNPSFNNVTVQNISMGATSGSLLLTSTDPAVGSAGWIGQANYSGGANNQIVNCVNGAPVYGAGVGGIMGSGAGQVGGSITFTKCTNNGSINGAGAGGIVGNNASNVVITTSRNMGPIQGALAGGIMGSGVSNSSLTNSFNRGSIGAGAAGLIGSTNLGPIPVTNCYSSGPLNGQGAKSVVGQDTNLAVQKRNLYTPNGQRYWSNTDADKFLTGTQGSVWSNLGAINPSSDSPYELSATLTIPDEASIDLNMYGPNSGDSYDNEPLVVTGPNPTLYADGSFSILWVSDGTNDGLGLTNPSFSIDPNTGEMVLTKDAFSVTSGLIIIVIQYTPNDASPVTIGVFYYYIHTILTIGQGDIYSAAWPWTLTGYTSVQFSENVSFNDLSQYFIVGGDAVTFDGSGHTVSFNNVPGYAGLIQNNEANLNTGSNYKNIVVQNISVKANAQSYLAANAGWLGQTNFAGSNGTVQFISCYNTAPVADYCGGIVGSNCADNYGSVTFTQCSNTGVIGKSAGGICGPAAGSSSGSVSMLECYNQGAVGLESGLVASVDGRALSVSFNNCYSTSPDLVGQNGGLASIKKTKCYNSAAWQDSAAESNLIGVSLLGSGSVWTALGNNTPFLFVNQLSLVGHYQEGFMYSRSEIFGDNNAQNVIDISDSFTGEFSILYISDGTSPSDISINSYGSVTIPAVAFTTLGPKTIYVGLSGDTNYIGYIHYTPLNYIYVDQAAVDTGPWPQVLNEAYTKVYISGGIMLSDSSQYFMIGADNVTIDGQNNTIDISGVYPGLVQSGYPGLVQNNGFKNATIQNIIIFSTDSMLMDGAGWIAQDGFNGKNNLIQYCNNSADITGVGCGGIVGQNVTDLSLKWCSNYGQISGQNCGGIVGQLAGIIDINGCSNAGSIAGQQSGGICGPYASRINIYSSSNVAKIIANGAGGIIGAFAGYQSGLVELNQCYNIGEIMGLQAGGLCGSSSAFDKGTILIYNSYNSGIGIGGFFGSIDSSSNGVGLSECYNVGTTDLTTSGSGKITRTRTYSIQSADLWSDVDASLNGLEVPLTKPGSSSIWTSLKENTPFLLKSFLQLEEGVSANLLMYSSEPEINGIDNSGTYLTNSQADGSYSIIHISDDTMVGINIDSTTGTITISPNAFSTVGLKTVYVKEASNNQIGYFYYHVYNEVYRINNFANWPTTTMDYTYISIDSDITLTGQTITIGGDNVWIYGNGHTINFAGATDYPGLINNGSNAQVGFNNIIIHGIVVTADVTSSLAPNAGWLAQSYFGNRANGNRIDNCSSLAPISSVGCGGIAGAFCANGGNLDISGCSNSGIMTSDSVGGIIGQYAAANGGNLTVNQCSNMGAIQASNSAGIMSVKAGFVNGSVTLDHCTNVGVVSGNGSAGLICNSGKQSSITVGNSYSRDKMTSLMGTVDPLSQSVAFSNCYSLNSIVSNDTESIATNPNCYMAGDGGWSDSDAIGVLFGGPPIPGSGEIWTSIGYNVPFFLSTEFLLADGVANNSNMYSPNTVENDSNYVNQSVMSGIGTGVYRVLYVSDGTNPASIVIGATSGQITLNSASFIGTRTIYVLDYNSNRIGYLTYTNYNLFVDQTFINNMNGNYTVVEGTIINFINGISMPVGQYLIAADDYITFDGSSIKVTDMGLTGIEFDYSIRIV